MLILKITGIILVLGTGGLSAVFSIRLEKRKLAVLAGWTDLIWFIRSRVECYSMPLPKILSGADPSLLEACACRQPVGELQTVYLASKPYLDAEAGRLLCAFMREFDYGQRKELLHRCDHYIAELGALRAKRAKELPAKVRILYALCIGASVFVSLMLW